MKIWKHAPNDWCHICGDRSNDTVDVWYPENAEHDKEDTMKYIRICMNCAEKILAACRKDENNGKVIVDLSGSEYPQCPLRSDVNSCRAVSNPDNTENCCPSLMDTLETVVESDCVWSVPDWCPLKLKNGGVVLVKSLPPTLGMSADDFSHLTKDQKDAIMTEAISCRFQACQEDPHYLLNAVSDLAKRDDIQSLLESISTDEEEVRKLLGFDPWNSDGGTP